MCRSVFQHIQITEWAMLVELKKTHTKLSKQHFKNFDKAL